MLYILNYINKKTSLSFCKSLFPFKFYTLLYLINYNFSLKVIKHKLCLYPSKNVSDFLQNI